MELCVELCSWSLECDQTETYTELLARLLRHGAVARRLLQSRNVSAGEMIERFVMQPQAQASLLFSLLDAVDDVPQRLRLLHDVVDADAAAGAALVAVALQQNVRKRSFQNFSYLSEVSKSFQVSFRTSRNRILYFYFMDRFYYRIRF